MLVFTEAHQPSKAMIAYEKALNWQDLFDLAAREHVGEEEIVSMGYRVSGLVATVSLECDLILIFSSRAEDLTSKKRYSEAARVLLDYAQDSRQAVIALVQGNSFSEARRIVSQIAVIGSTIVYLVVYLAKTTLAKQPELLVDIVYPGALESLTQVADDILEMKEQLRNQLNRIQELRIKKVEEPGKCLKP